jgi:MATE family multidrug resistance protein
MSTAVIKIEEESRPRTELLKLALPIIAMTASRMLMGFIDFVMITELGTAAQAAISPASLLVFTFLCLGMGATMTVQSFVSQSCGKGEPREGSAYAWQSIYLGLAGTALVWPLVYYVRPFFEWLGPIAGHAPEVREMEIEYTAVALWSFAPCMIATGLDGFFTGVQKPRISLIAILVSIVFNVVGNYALIYGHFGFPAMGMTGAALATVLGWWVRAGVLMAAFLAPVFNELFSTRAAYALSMHKLGQLVKIGTPSSAQMVLDIGAWVVFLMVIMSRFGTEALAATNIVIQYMHLSFMPAIGLGIALVSKVGFAIGEGRPDIAVSRTRMVMQMNIAYMGTMGLLFILFRRPFMEMLSEDPGVIAAGAYIMIWAGIFQGFDALWVTYSNALRAAGDTRWPAVIVFICVWGIHVGGGLLMSSYLPQWGVNGPWLTCTAYVIILGLLLYFRFMSGAWKSIKIFGTEETGEPKLVPAPEKLPG